MSNPAKKLALYEFPSCPFCRRVMDAIDALGVEVELRDIQRDSDFRDELQTATGRSTVPVLRIEDGAGDVQWMPESLDIIAYLREQTGA